MNHNVITSYCDFTAKLKLNYTKIVLNFRYDLIMVSRTALSVGKSKVAKTQLGSLINLVRKYKFVICILLMHPFVFKISLNVIVSSKNRATNFGFIQYNKVHIQTYCTHFNSPEFPFVRNVPPLAHYQPANHRA